MRKKHSHGARQRADRRAQHAHPRPRSRTWGQPPSVVASPKHEKTTKTGQRPSLQSENEAGRHSAGQFTAALIGIEAIGPDPNPSWRGLGDEPEKEEARNKWCLADCNSVAIALRAKLTAAPLVYRLHFSQNGWRECKPPGSDRAPLHAPSNRSPKSGHSCPRRLLFQSSSHILMGQISRAATMSAAFLLHFFIYTT